MRNPEELEVLANVDLRMPPVRSSRANQSMGLPGIQNWVTLGDLHGNSLKLMNFIGIEGGLSIPDAQYSIFVELYQHSETDKRLGPEIKLANAKRNPDPQVRVTAVADAQATLDTVLADLPGLKAEEELRVGATKRFYREVLPHVTVTPGANIRAIGDCFGDRGANDFYTLLLIGKLIDGGANVEILLSNHDALFIRWMEAKLAGRTIEPWNEMFVGQAESLKRLDELVRLGVVQMDHLAKLYNQYKQTLKLLSYDYNEKGQLVLYSHAHLDERDVLAIASGLLDEFGDKMSPEVKARLEAVCERLNNDPNAMISEEDTKALVDDINVVVRECADKNDLHSLLNLNKHSMTPTQLNGENIDPTLSPVHYAIWNRDDIDVRVQDRPKNPNIINVHGHNTYQQQDAICLDNPFGKPGRNHNVGTLTYTRTAPVNVLEIKCAQINELLQFMIARHNIILQRDAQGKAIITSPTSFDPTVNTICLQLTTCFGGSDFAKISDVSTDNAEKINQLWTAIDHLLERQSHPSRIEKMRRGWNERMVERIEGPKATTQQIINRWESSKVNNTAVAVRYQEKRNRPHN